MDGEATAVTATNGSFVTNGKIGKCLKLGYTNNIIIPSLIGSKKMSWAYWCRIDEATATNWLDPIHWTSTKADGSDGYISRQEFYTNCTNTGVWYKGGSLARGSFGDIVIGEWNHFAFTIDYEVGEAVFYINGNQVSKGTTVDTTHQIAAIHNIRLGENGLSVSENDVRIYNEILSPKVIKELSKGLVCHYTLSGGGGENLLSRYVVPGQNGPTSTATSGRTNWLGDYKIKIPATESADTYFRLFTTKQLTANAIYTISCQVDGLLDGSYYNFPLFAQNNAGMGVLQLNHNGLCSLTFTMTYGTQTTATGANGETVYICFMDDLSRSLVSGQGAITLSNFKLEEGSVATPWIPNPSDPLYAKMGFDDGIEYDVSGYGRNGTKYDSFKYTTDTPRYITAIEKTDNTKPAIQIPTIWETGTIVNELTLSCWHKTDTANNNTKNIINLHGNSFLRFGLNTAKALWVYGNSSGINGSYTLPFSGTDNVWHLYTLTFKDGILKAYFDGEIIGTKDFSSTTQHLTISTNSSFIGAYLATGSEITPGSFSDARIYATALSADDILALYNTPISLSSNGTLLTQGELTEV